MDYDTGKFLEKLQLQNIQIIEQNDQILKILEIIGDTMFEQPEKKELKKRKKELEKMIEDENEEKRLTEDEKIEIETAAATEKKEIRNFTR